MEAFRESIGAILEEIQPASIRQTYYQCTVRSIVEKTEPAYRSVDRNLTQMRRARRIPFGWITDNTRYVHKTRSYTDLADMLEMQQEFYRRALWNDRTCMSKSGLKRTRSPASFAT
jgi:hypothetical protein